MYRFRLVGGTFHDDNQKVYKRGDIVEHPKRLDEAFPKCFTLLPDEPTPAPTPEPEPDPSTDDVPPDPPAPDDADDEDGGDDEVEEGEDVTDQFPVALEANFSVYCRGRGSYWVYDADGEIRNDEPLTKAQTLALVKTNASA